MLLRILFLASALAVPAAVASSLSGTVCLIGLVGSAASDGEWTYVGEHTVPGAALASLRMPSSDEPLVRQETTRRLPVWANRWRLALDLRTLFRADERERLLGAEPFRGFPAVPVLSAYASSVFGRRLSHPAELPPVEYPSWIVEVDLRAPAQRNLREFDGYFLSLSVGLPSATDTDGVEWLSDEPLRLELSVGSPQTR